MIFDYVSQIGQQGLGIYLLLCFAAWNRTTFIVERSWLAEASKLSDFQLVRQMSKLRDAGLVEFDALAGEMELTLVDPRSGEVLRLRDRWFWINNFLVTHYAHFLGLGALSVYAGLASLIRDDSQICLVESDRLARHVGYAGRSSLQRPMGHLKKHQLVQSASCYWILEDEVSESGLGRSERNPIARQTWNRYRLLDVPELRPGRARRSREEHEIAFDLFVLWASHFQVRHATGVPPSLKPHQQTNLKKLVTMVMAQTKRSAPDVYQLLVAVTDLAIREDFSLPEPDTLYHRINQLKLLPGSEDLWTRWQLSTVPLTDRVVDSKRNPHSERGLASVYG